MSGRRSLVYLALGILLLFGAFHWTQRTRAFLSTAVRAQGTVIDLVPMETGDRDTLRPVVRFVDRSGKTVEFTSETGSQPSPYDVGDKVTVLYDPSSPKRAEVNRFFDLWGGPVILGGLGTMFLLAGLGAFSPSRGEADRGARR